MKKRILCPKLKYSERVRRKLKNVILNATKISVVQHCFKQTQRYSSLIFLLWKIDFSSVDQSWINAVQRFSGKRQRRIRAGTLLVNADKFWTRRDQRWLYLRLQSLLLFTWKLQQVPTFTLHILTKTQFCFVLVQAKNGLLPFGALKMLDSWKYFEENIVLKWPSGPSSKAA